jgi:4'-phosphopantetheinyl transferase
MLNKPTGINQITGQEIQWLNYQLESSINKIDTSVFKIHKSIYQKITCCLTSVLPKVELEKAGRFIQQSDRERYILGKFFSRILLGKLLGKEPIQINFSYTLSNKPYVMGINFNISHSGDYIVMAFSNFPIGIDIEWMDIDLNYQLLISNCFTINEANCIHNLKDFYTFWTRKESILKATGEGLIDNLHEIEVQEMAATRNLNTYLLKSFKVDEKHMLSLAVNLQEKNLSFWEINQFEKNLIVKQ